MVTSRASGMSAARIRPFATGTIGSSVPAITSVGCERKGSQGRLLAEVAGQFLRELLGLVAGAGDDQD